MSKEVPEIIDEFYTENDKKAEEFVKKEGMSISCRKGCHGCCFQMIGVSAAEAVHMVTKMASRKDIREIIRQCFIAAKAILQYKTATEGFRKRVPCVFLRDGLCSIYAIRPTVCRYYFVHSPPEACYPEAPTEGIELYDMHTQLINYPVNLTMVMRKEHPEKNIPIAGPLPAMLVWAASMLFTGGDKIWANKLLAKLPPSQYWTNVLLLEEG